MSKHYFIKNYVDTILSSALFVLMWSVVESARRGNKTNSGECAIPM